MNYAQTLDYLYSQLPMYQRIGKAAYKASLDNTIALCNLLDNPQDKFRSVHIAGTNGKGSTAHLLSSVMQAHGLKTGLYTSPHLVDFRERIRINGRMIHQDYVVQFVNDYKEGFESIQPSFFEMTAGLAFDYFAREQVDIGIIEVGMGGRLDSTNIITPLVSVITNIGFDHTQFLGNTLQEIAAEKAGIIKAGIPVVIGERQEEISKVFTHAASSLGSAIVFASDQWHPSNEAVSEDGLKLDLFKDGKICIPGLQCPLSGLYTVKNIITTLSVIEVLKDSGFCITLEETRRGISDVIASTGLAGRWQVLSRKPLTICDVGHNYDGLSMTMMQIRDIPYKHMHFVLGSVNDKKLDDIFRLLPGKARYYFCKPGIPRGLDQHELMQMAGREGLHGKAYESVWDAYAEALANADEDDLVFVGGSTFVVAEVLARLDAIPR